MKTFVVRRKMPDHEYLTKLGTFVASNDQLAAAIVRKLEVDGEFTVEEQTDDEPAKSAA